MFAFYLLAEGGKGPNTSLMWLLYVGIAFFLLIVIVGWWVSSKKEEHLPGTHEAVKSKSKKSADDLVKIEGIGPKVVKVLKEAGNVTFAELADGKVEDIQKVLDQAGLQMMNPEGWIAQARLAAKGDWQAFEKLKTELKGGRIVK